MKNAQIRLISALREHGCKDVAEHLMELFDRRDEQHKAINEKIDNIHERQATLSTSLDHFIRLELEHYTEMKNAFPGSDLQAHRAYHLKLMKAAEAQEHFWNTMTNRVAEKGILMAIVIILGLIATGLSIKAKAWLGL